MKKIGVLLVCICLILGTFGLSSASVIETVQLQFESGAVWQGTITFTDDYVMTDTAGYLNGGSNSYENLYFNWTWRVTPDNDGYDNPGDNNHDNYMDDWLMHEDETVETDSHYISLSWDQQASIDAGAINFQLLDDAPYFSGYVHEWTNGAMITTDIITSASSGAPVPEPATMLLFGLGLLGLAGVNRRKK